MRLHVSPRRVRCLCAAQRWLHTSEDTNGRMSGSSDVGGESVRSAGRLRPWAWLRLHPVEKWTTLVDLGRRTPTLLESSSLTDDEGGRNEKKQGGSVMNFAARISRWPKRAGSNDALLQAQLSPAALRRHHQLVHNLPYCVRLRLCLSFLMWVRSLRDVQDTFSRLLLPHAYTRRVQRSIVADVFPTRIMERFIDPFTTVAVKLDSDINSTAEQVPAPHAWHPEHEENDREEERKRSIRRRSVVGKEQRLGKWGKWRYGVYACHPRLARDPRKLLRDIQAMRPRASDDDDKVIGRQTRLNSSRSLKQTPFGSSVCHKETMSSAPSSWAVNDACRSALPSPLAVDHREDEEYHHNFLRGEGCPLDENGHLQSTPIHIAVPSTEGSVLDLERYCVMAHAAVLSSLFVEGRTVSFTTNHRIVLEYIMFLFDELIEDGWVSASLRKEFMRPYVPAWSLNESVLVLLPPGGKKSFHAHDLRNIADMILQCAPCNILIETTSHNGGENYMKALMKEVEKKQMSMIVTPQTKAYWRVSWIPVSSSSVRVVGGVHDNVHETLEEFQSAVNEILRHFYRVGFIYIPSNCRFTPRQLQEWWWNKLPTSVHVVAVNSHPLDLLYYFPQAPFLRKKIGNSLRYRAVQRVLLGKNVYGGREDRLRQWIHRWFCWRGHTRTGLQGPMAAKDKARVLLNNHASVRRNNDDNEAVDALKWERTVDYLANPSRLHWAALMAAKFFRV